MSLVVFLIFAGLAVLVALWMSLGTSAVRPLPAEPKRQQRRHINPVTALMLCTLAISGCASWLIARRIVAARDAAIEKRLDNLEADIDSIDARIDAIERYHR